MRQEIPIPPAVRPSTAVNYPSTRRIHAINNNDDKIPKLPGSPWDDIHRYVYGLQGGGANAPMDGHIGGIRQAESPQAGVLHRWLENVL